MKIPQKFKSGCKTCDAYNEQNWYHLMTQFVTFKIYIFKSLENTALLPADISTAPLTSPMPCTNGICGAKFLT